MATTEDRTAVNVLRSCSLSTNCTNLRDYLVGRKTLNDLGYEDVFYPLRCHHGDGLALEVDYDHVSTITYVWGAGDLIYNISDDRRMMETAVEAGPVWREIDNGAADIDVMIIEDEAQEAER